MKFNTKAYDILQERGFIMLESHANEIKEKLSKEPVTFYLGIDPTADDLHIGHIFALQMFRILQDCGHKGIILLGGATAMIGDPSFKNDMRKLMTKDEIDNNIREIHSILHRFIDMKDNSAIVVNNGDWIRPKGYIEFMREVGTHFNVAKMLASECYKNRLKEGGLTFFEMGYMLMQAYDFVHLSRTYNCTMQIGGSDQWANILSGVDVARKMNVHDGTNLPQLYALCCPLLTKADGTKMGKTEKGVLWVNRGETSAYDCYQHFVNVDDADVERLLRFFTSIPVAEIIDACKNDIVNAKKLMAFEVTKKIHGEESAIRAQETAKKLFSANGDADTAPTETINIARGASVVDMLALTSIIKSKREARELITGGAITINQEKVTDVNATLDQSQTSFLIKKGKKTFLRVNLEN